MTDNSKVIERVISKEEAVFWMDEQGRWCNAHGPFEHKKIIQYFNTSIDRDERGYFVSQEYNGMREKVYFRYHVTPLSALDLIEAEPPHIVLNTGKVISLVAANLYILHDQLYFENGDECVRLSERVLVKLSDRLKYENDVYFFRSGQTLHPIREIKQSSET